MYIIVGLGNPGSKYRNTRHNMGFETVEMLSSKFSIPTDFLKHKAMCGKGMIDGSKVILAMPQTFMNLSGQSVRELTDYYKIDVESELIVIYDDIDLEPGQVRIRKSGSAGGHNGMKDIVKCLGSTNFYRIRVGVGAKPSQMDLADYVLGHFTDKEREDINKGISLAAEGVSIIINDGIDAAMNKINSQKKKENKKENTNEGS